MPNRLVVFDFDGTLITQNSFPRWVAFLLRRSFIEFRIRTLLLIAIALLERKILKTQDHLQFKESLMRLTYPADWDMRFAATLLPSVNPAVERCLQRHLSTGAQVIISSAAPINYLKELNRVYPSEPLTVIASEIEEGRLRDNYKEAKLSALGNRGLLAPDQTIDILYTDSIDDLSLAHRSARVFLCAPDVQSVREYQKDPRTRHIIEFL